MKWTEKSNSIVLFMIFFLPLGLYFVWKNPYWSQERKTTIFLIFVFPLGIYQMFKYDLWSKKKRLIITIIIGFMILLIGSPSNSINEGSIYKFKNVHNCPETEGGIYFKIKDKSTLLLWSVSEIDYKRQCCKTEISYSKSENEFVFESVLDTQIYNECMSQFMGSYKIKDGNWTNGKVSIELSTKTNDLR